MALAAEKYYRDLSYYSCRFKADLQLSYLRMQPLEVLYKRCSAEATSSILQCVQV